MRNRVDVRDDGTRSADRCRCRRFRSTTQEKIFERIVSKEFLLLFVVVVAFVVRAFLNQIDERIFSIAQNRIAAPCRRIRRSRMWKRLCSLVLVAAAAVLLVRWDAPLDTRRTLDRAVLR